MQMFIGQERIKNLINNLNELPPSLILKGDFGSGRHTICSLLADKFNSTIKTINDVDLNNLNDLESVVSSTIYIFESKDLTPGNINKLLKFIEEPPALTHNIIILENFNYILPTLINRCQIWELDPYTDEELAQFGPVSIITNTPGKVLKFKTTPVEDITKLVDLIFDKVKIANVSNILTIPNKLNLDGKDDGKFDPVVFITLLNHIAKKRAYENPINYRLYELTNNLYNEWSIPKVNHQLLLEHFLLDLKLL